MKQGPLDPLDVSEPHAPLDPQIPPRYINTLGQSTQGHVMAEVCRACHGTILIRFAYAPNHCLEP